MGVCAKRSKATTEGQPPADSSGLRLAAPRTSLPPSSDDPAWPSPGQASRSLGRGPGANDRTSPARRAALGRGCVTF